MKTLKNFVLVSLCTIAALIVLACSEAGGPVAPRESDEQVVAALVLLHDGKPVATADNQTATGILTVQIGQNPDVYTVEFYNEDRELINYDPRKYELKCSFENSELATFEHPEELNEWEFQIHGKRPGDTTFQLRIENEERVSYTGPSIPLKVR